MENQNQENVANKNTNRKRYYHRRRFTPKPDAVPAKDQNIQPVQQPQKQVQQPRPSLQQQNIKQQKPQQKPQVKKLSVVVPLFNEQDSLQPLSAEIRKVCIANNFDFEVIFVDDGSTDNSLKVIKDICRGDRRFKYISFQKNYGKSAALNIGFKKASGTVVVTMDADLQDDPGEIPNLILKLNEGFDMVSGWKKKRYDPFIKKHSSKFFNAVTRWFSGVKIHDFNCGLKIYKKNVLDQIRVYGELHRYIPVLANWKGFSVAELVVTHHPRKFGYTKFGISRFFKGFVDLLTVVFITRYAKRPMHLFGFLGAFSLIGGTILNLVLTYQKLFHNMPLSNRPMLFLGVLLIIVGMQFFSLGLIGEMMVSSSHTSNEYTLRDSNI
ncbi:MAG TPA: glycosyltransferase family 2 protein [Ignavibacteriaceae bacterium]|nr:glycosyltransferase family 2 protein [Ignavibacteriaceae bacterium]HPO57011.1 glycosyltransferase family 2 protein [Ignavibacteriaceae bacterium]